MIKIAITGNIASGKSTVEQIIKAHGYKVLCADEVSHGLLDNDKDVVEKVLKLFNTTDRKAIGEMVFKNPKLKKELEKLIHPKIKEEIDIFLKKNNAEKLVFVSVPLLYEAKFENIFDKVILVCAERKTRLERLIKRNSFTEGQANARIEAQIEQSQKEKLADYLMDNNKSLKELKKQTLKIIKALELL